MPLLLAEQLAGDPPFDPLQVHDHGPVPDTPLAVPAVQRLVVGAAVNICPFDEPQTPLTGVLE